MKMTSTSTQNSHNSTMGLKNIIMNCNELYGEKKAVHWKQNTCQKEIHTCISLNLRARVSWMEGVRWGINDWRISFERVKEKKRGKR